MISKRKLPKVEFKVGKRMTEGVNLTMIYYKNFCRCNNAPPVQQFKKKETNSADILILDVLVFKIMHQ
jgi:hypothetical protein